MRVYKAHDKHAQGFEMIGGIIMFTFKFVPLAQILYAGFVKSGYVYRLIFNLQAGCHKISTFNIKKTIRAIKLIMLLIFCSSALYAQITIPKAGTQVFENQIKLSHGNVVIKLCATHNGYVLSFPDKKNYLVTGKYINLITETQFQRIKTSPANAVNKIPKRTTLVSAFIKNVNSESKVWQTKEVENAIEIPADLPEGTYEVYAKVVEKATSGLKDTLKTQVRMNIVKEKEFIIVIMEESLIN